MKKLLMVIFVCLPAYAQNNPKVHSPKIEQNSGIPSDLVQAMHRLEVDLPPDALSAVRSEKTFEFISKSNRKVAVFARDKWNLKGDSAMVDFFHRNAIDDPRVMANVVADSFWAATHKKLFSLKDKADFYARYRKSAETPKGNAPTDGAKISWILAQGGTKGIIHLGVSESERSFWRYDYASGRGVEPALPAEAKTLAELNRREPLR